MSTNQIEVCPVTIQTKTTRIAKQYAEQGVAGEISACKWVHVDDRIYQGISGRISLARAVNMHNLFVWEEV